MKPRIAIVTIRCHEKLVGGAEALAWQYAGLLTGDFAVEILTSSAFDYTYWKNDLALIFWIIIFLKDYPEKTTKLS